MKTAAALCHINLLLALVQRLLAGLLCRGENRRIPPAPLARTLARAQAALAAEFRVALAVGGQAAPVLDDSGLIAWFNAHHPGSEQSSFQAPRSCAGEGAGDEGAERTPRRRTVCSLAFEPLMFVPIPPARAPP